ncbi:MAG TPA: DUF3179 domain-containing protein [Anaerolineales bacterium]|nr:DUF3179 domain-containing protein [Anaerolineales bacterium]
MTGPGKLWKQVGLFGLVLLPAACAPIAAGDPEPPAAALQTTELSAVTLSPTESPTPALLPEETPPAGAEFEFTTDFSKHTVPYGEIHSGGPPKDGIPAIDDPQFVSVTEADAWLEEVEPVILFEHGGDARAYPLQVLMWHEIVNDIVGGLPVTITFCPLCNTAIAFDRTVDGRVLDFGTTGRLHRSNLIMYDRQTETWWQQATGEAIAGELTGTRLTFLPAPIIAWADFKIAYPEGTVLSRETGFNRPYGRNPYAGYDDVNRPPFLYLGPELEGPLPPVARVLALDLNGEAKAYPYDVLSQVKAVNDTVGGVDIAVFWTPGTSSALDAGTVAGGRDVGTANAFDRRLDGQLLTFRIEGDEIVDDQTGSAWNILGQAVSGPLEGEQLTPIVAVNHFWFSWAAFKPETEVYQP